MPRALPSDPALIVTDPAPLESAAGFPHVIVEFPIGDLIDNAGFGLLPPATDAPRPDSLPRPGEPEAAL